MTELEDNLLLKLANSQGDILEDIELIENLEETKKTALDIEEKVSSLIPGRSLGLLGSCRFAWGEKLRQKSQKQEKCIVKWQLEALWYIS